MTEFGSGADNPSEAIALALSDLAAMLRGGGSAGNDPDEVSARFATAVKTMVADQPLQIDVDDQGLFQGEEPFWASELLARRVGDALRSQGLDHFSIDHTADTRGLQGLAVLLTRDWKKEGSGALQAIIRRGATPGIDFEFSSTVPEAVGGGLDPAVLLNLVRAGKFEKHSDLAPALAAIRARLEEAADTNNAVSGSSDASRAQLAPELEAIERRSDVDPEHLGRIAFHTVRLDSAGLQAADTFRLMIDRFEQLVREGRPGLAICLVGRTIGLARDPIHSAWPHRALIEAELNAFFDEGALGRLTGAANGGEGDIDVWRRLFFVLSGAVPLDKLEPLAAAAGQLEQGLFRQAVADGIALRVGRDVELLDRLLHRITGPGQAVVLRAIGRLDAPTMLEKLLARMDSDLPVVRQDALVALRKHRSPRTQERVRSAITDADPGVRVEALRYVSVYRDAAAAPVILSRMNTIKAGAASDTELRAMGMALAIILRHDAIRPLSRVAQDAAVSRPGVARAAVAGLATLGDSGRSAINGLARTGPELRAIVRDSGAKE